MVLKTLIRHPEMGLFVGVGMGMAFWTRLETAGQWELAWFFDEAAAREFIGTWRPIQDPEKYTYPVVECSILKRGVTVDELVKAGLEDDAKMLLLNMPAESRA